MAQQQEEESIESLLKKANKRDNSGKYEESIKIATQILEREPKNVDALFLRGSGRRMLNKNHLAVIDLKEADNLKPNSTNILSSLAATQMKTGDLENSIKNLEKSIKIKSKNAFTIQHLGSAYLLKGNFEEALKYLNEADKLEPDNWWTLWQRGIVYRKLGKLNESIIDLKTALELKPKSQLIAADLVDTFREMKLFERALNQIKISNNVRALTVKAHIYIDMGNLKEAENCLKEAEPKLEHWDDIQHFQEVKKLFQEKKDSQPLIERLIEDSKKEPTKTLAKMTESINKLQSEMAKANLEKMNQVVIEASKAYNGESGGAIVLELRKNVVELKQEIKILENKNKTLEFDNKESQTLNKEHERRLQCMICMDKPRDTVVMPCLHFLFCNSCIQEHNKISKQCPSCRQPMSGNLTCLLEGAEPIRKLKEKEKESEKNGNKKRPIEVIEIKEEHDLNNNNINDDNNNNNNNNNDDNNASKKQKLN